MMKRTTITTLTIALLFALGGCTLVTDFDAPSGSLYSIDANLTNNVVVSLNGDEGTLELSFVKALPSGHDEEIMAMLEDNTIGLMVQTSEAVSFSIFNDGQWSDSPSNPGDYFMELTDSKTLSIDFINEVSTGQTLHVGGDYQAIITVNPNDYFKAENDITRDVTVQ